MRFTYLYTDPYATTDSELGYSTGYTHGYKVVSALVSLVRNAKVIVINSNSFGGSDVEYWRWLDENRYTSDIDVISMSFSIYGPVSAYVDKHVTNLYHKRVLMVGGMGNDGSDTSSYFPVSHRYVYGVGSIYHETQNLVTKTCSWWIFGCRTTVVEGYYSVEGKITGTSIEGQQNMAACLDNSRAPFCSSYGSSYPLDPGITDFVMPGHGVSAMPKTFLPNRLVVCFSR